MGTFGETSTTDSNPVTIAPGRIRMSPFTLAENGTVTKISAYMKNDESADQVFRCLIYDDDGDGGAPYTLKGTTNEVNVPFVTTVDWIDFAFASGVKLTAGTYYLGFIAGGATGSGKVYYRASGEYWGEDGATYPTPSNPSGASELGSAHWCLYATYSTGGILPLLNQLLLGGD